jgi:hypothetical protein
MNFREELQEKFLIDTSQEINEYDDKKFEAFKNFIFIFWFLFLE